MKNWTSIFNRKTHKTIEWGKESENLNTINQPGQHPEANTKAQSESSSSSWINQPSN